MSSTAELARMTWREAESRLRDRPAGLLPVGAFAMGKGGTGGSGGSGGTGGGAGADHDVIIVGAGSAGLYAAFELNNLGFDVLVLEAQDRHGGRV